MTIKIRIASWFTLFTIFFLVLMGVSVYYFTWRDRKASFGKRLMNRAFSTAKLYVDSATNRQLVLQKVDSAGFAALEGRMVAILDERDSVVYHYSSEPGDSLVLKAEILREVKSGKDQTFFYSGREAIAIWYNQPPRQLTVMVAAIDRDGKEMLLGLRNIISGIIIVGIFFAFLLGYLFSRQLVQPIARIIRQVNRITHSNLSSRIGTSGNKDELYRLAATFNDLLDRLEESFAIQRRFISNASHELSTPLTSVSSQLEVTLQKDRSPEEYRQVMASVYEDVQHMQQLTRSLLEIARTGTAGGIDLKEVRIDEVILKVVANVEKQHADFRVELNFGEFPEDEDTFLVFGNPDLLYTAIRNIIENGCKYADDKTAAVDLSFNGKEVLIRIKNRGDVIAESDIQNIFQPFFRAGTAQGKQGFGLGLTLTRRIVQLHKGEIRVESDPHSGTVFTIILPTLQTIRNAAGF